MLLAQDRFWRVTVAKGKDAVMLAILKEALPAELEELRDLRIEVPFEKWHRVVKQIRSDRKLLGGILLDFAKNQDHLAIAVGSDRLYQALQRVVTDATAALLEEGMLALVPVTTEA